MDMNKISLSNFCATNFVHIHRFSLVVRAFDISLSFLVQVDTQAIALSRATILSRRVHHFNALIALMAFLLLEILFDTDVKNPVHLPAAQNHFDPSHITQRLQAVSGQSSSNQ